MSNPNELSKGSKDHKDLKIFKGQDGPEGQGQDGQEGIRKDGKDGERINPPWGWAGSVSLLGPGNNQVARTHTTTETGGRQEADGTKDCVKTIPGPGEGS